ncbi:threonine/serine dehydratase [bacterium]|nr:threonine/serine dehydratase [bacterium]
MSFTDTVKEAFVRIQPYILRTPLVRSDLYSRMTGHDVWFKCENMQVTHAFKIRGALTRVLSVDGEALRGKILITASGGNHGLAVTHAARILKLKAMIYLPEGTPELKIRAIRDLGGDIRITGRDWDEANERAMHAGKDARYLYIHPFDDDLVIQGQATVALEILEQTDRPDIIMASIGGGGLISGIAQYAKSVFPQIRVYGVETAGCDSMTRSIQAGKLTALNAITSKAESLGARMVTERTFRIVREYVDDLFVVKDAEAEYEQVRLLEEEKQHTELAASCVVSACLKHVPPSDPGKKIVIVLCGGNVSLKIKNKD